VRDSRGQFSSLKSTARGLKEALEALFGRSVDLVEAGASSNRYFLESVNKSRRLLYAA
jgi:hypothetical protein